MMRLALSLLVGLFVSGAAAQTPFAPPEAVDFSGLAGPFAVHVVPLDGDDRPDLLLSGDDGFGWLRNEGGGQFGPYQPIGFGQRPNTAVLPTDVDGDGDVDLLRTDGTDIRIYANQGDATFATPTVLFGMELGERLGPLADLDGDGAVDALSFRHNPTTGGTDIRLRTRTPDGGFVGPRLLSDEAGTHLVIRLADLDGDDDLDIVTGTQGPNTQQYRLLRFRNQGEGQFSGRSGIATDPGRIGSIAAADLDGDGDRDLVMSQYAGATWFANEGDGSFGAGSILDGVWTRGVRLGDLDGDGHVDVLTLRFDSTGTSWLRSNGDGTFAPAVSLPERRITTGASLADLDLDGDLDLVTLEEYSGDLLVYRNGTVATSTPEPPATDRPALAVLGANPSRIGVRLRVHLPPVEGGTLEVVDLLGRVVFASQEGPGTREVRVRDLAPGVYVARLLGDRPVEAVTLQVLR